MKASQFFISTLKEAPADAEVASHRLMMRAGMIKKLGAGIYTYMPMGLRVIRKVEAIVREEMNRAGAVELAMPVVQPAELWQESGRFEKMGPELLRIKDRHERDFVVQPTSEEVVTDIARQEIRSYKQLPKNFYQIQTKFRDERRPRFGLMRGREFIMKDAYSFDRDLDGAKASYQVMAQAYRRIFDRFGLRYRAVAADSGAIGGDVSRGVPGDRRDRRGRDRLLPRQRLRGQHGEGRGAGARRSAPARRRRPLAKTPTPGKSTCEDVAAAAGRAAGDHRQVAGAGDRHRRRRRQRQGRPGLAAAAARRPRHERDQGEQGAGPGRGLPLRHRGRDRGRTSAASPATSARST